MSVKPDEKSNEICYGRQMGFLRMLALCGGMRLDLPEYGNLSKLFEAAFPLLPRRPLDQTLMTPDAVCVSAPLLTPYML
jgi:hypothetical protein